MCHRLLAPTNKMLDSKLIICARDEDSHEFVRLVENLKADLKLDDTQLTYLLNVHANKLGKTVLHEAVQCQNEDNVEALLQLYHVDGDALKQGDWTPLMIAAGKNYRKIIKLLIDHGASLDAQNKDGWNVFHIACRSCDVDTVRSIWNAHINKTTARATVSKNGRSPLHTAVLHGRAEVVEYLLDEVGFYADVTDHCGCTPFMDAIRSANIQCAELLLKRTVNPYLTDKLGRNVLHIASEAGQLDSVRWILYNLSNIKVDGQTLNSGLTAIHLCAKEGHVEVLEYLHRVGGLLDLSDAHGRTALHHASMANKAACLLYLLQAGVNDTVDASHCTARTYASKPQCSRIWMAY